MSIQHHQEVWGVDNNVCYLHGLVAHQHGQYQVFCFPNLVSADLEQCHRELGGCCWISGNVIPLLFGIGFGNGVKDWEYRVRGLSGTPSYLHSQNSWTNSVGSTVSGSS